MIVQAIVCRSGAEIEGVLLSLLDRATVELPTGPRLVHPMFDLWIGALGVEVLIRAASR